MKYFRLPSPVDASLLRYLNRLKIDCANNLSFHRMINLLSAVLGQLNYFSLKLVSSTSLSNPLIISGDTIQKLCIDRLNPLSIYTLYLSFSVETDLTEKILFTSFVKSSFTSRKRPKVLIHEEHRDLNNYNSNHIFIVYTLPYVDKELTTWFIPEDLEMCVEHI